MDFEIIFAEYNVLTNYLTGFYMKEIHDDIPVNCVKITKQLWEDLRNSKEMYIVTNTVQAEDEIFDTIAGNFEATKEPPQAVIDASREQLGLTEDIELLKAQQDRIKKALDELLLGGI